MTIVISPGAAAEKAAAGNQNNPHILWDDQAASGTWSTQGGTEIEAASNIATGTTFDPWVANALADGDVRAEVVLPSAQRFTFAAIAAHNLSDLNASVRLEYSTNGGSTWVDAGAGLVTPTDNQAIGWLFTEAPAADRWRFNVDASTNDIVEIGCAFLGTELIIPQRIYQGYTPPITPTRVDLQSNVSEGNHLLGSAVIRRGSSSTAQLSDIPDGYVRGSAWMDFQRHFNNGRGFFWAWRPSKYGDLYYAWRSAGPIIPSNSGPLALMSFDMEMRFYDDPEGN